MSAILLEGIGRMVLLIPAAVNKLLDQGRREGRQQMRQEIADWLRRKQEVEARGEPFDEPMPSGESKS